MSQVQAQTPSPAPTPFTDTPKPNLAIAGASTLLLAACGAGNPASPDAGPTPPPPPGPPPPPIPFDPIPATKAEAARFLGQASLDSVDLSIDHLMQVGYSAWLDEQMQLSFTQSYKDWLIEKNFHVVTATDTSNRTGHGGWPQAVWCKLFSSPDSMRQKMVFAWTQLFVVSGTGLEISWRNFAIANYLDMFERMAFANFRDILESVTLSSAMGYYLNMRGNRKADPRTGRVPDENYSREVMQLFTIGLYQLNPDGTLKRDSQGQVIESYTNEDTEGLAAALTGWVGAPGADPSGLLETSAHQHGMPMALDENQHSTTEKKFLGITIPAGTPGRASLKIALDTLFNHPNTGPFVARHFIQRFITSNPSPAYVGRVAGVFANNSEGVRGDMAAVIKAVLLDVDARVLDPKSSTFGKLREPVARLVQWGRSFGAQSSDWNMGFTNGDTTLGQMPMLSPSVFNFFRPGYAPPNTSISEAGLVAPEFQILAEPTVVSYVNWMALVVNNTRAVRVNYEAELETARLDIPALVARYNLWFAAGQLSARSLRIIENAIVQIQVPATGSPNAALENRVRAAVMLVMSSPEYLIQK